MDPVTFGSGEGSGDTIAIELADRVRFGGSGRSSVDDEDDVNSRPLAPPNSRA